MEQSTIAAITAITPATDVSPDQPGAHATTAERFARYAFHGWNHPVGEEALTRTVQRAAAVAAAGGSDLELAQVWLCEVLQVEWVNRAMLIEEGVPPELVARLPEPAPSTHGSGARAAGTRQRSAFA